MTNLSPLPPVSRADEAPDTDAAWAPAGLASMDFQLPADGHADARRTLAAAVTILEQGEDLLAALTAEAYTRCVPLAFNACMGGHYRHCLDHFTSVFRGLDADEVDYDHRERDVRIESEPEFARKATRQLRRQLEQFALGMFDTPVRVRCEVSYARGDSPVAGSTFGREIVYAIAHAIHHYALISIMARSMEVKLPAHFGVAPSTVAHQKAGAR
jgi:uncharacterized damage-inducible protein DinB